MEARSRSRVLTFGMHHGMSLQLSSLVEGIGGISRTTGPQARIASNLGRTPGPDFTNMHRSDVIVQGLGAGKRHATLRELCIGRGYLPSAGVKILDLGVDAGLFLENDPVDTLVIRMLAEGGLMFLGT